MGAAKLTSAAALLPACTPPSFSARFKMSINFDILVGLGCLHIFVCNPSPIKKGRHSLCWIFLCLLISALLWLQNCINLSGSLPLGVVMIVFKVPQLQSRADQPYGSAVKEAACRFFGACAFLDGIAHIRALIPAKVFQ